jgi:hypothetical protein
MPSLRKVKKLITPYLLITLHSESILLPDVSPPPEHLLIRWETWTDAASFYSDNFDNIQPFIHNFNSSGAV